MHFIFALVLVVYTFWVGLQLSVPATARLGVCGDSAALAGLRRWTMAILALLVVQLVYGALMAGHKAANVAPTWPDLNGDLVPAGMFRGPWLEALAGNRITVQFIHRTLAYVLFALVLVWTVKAIRLPAIHRSVSGALRCAAAAADRDVQILLGIGSLLTSPWIRPQHWVAFDWLAQFHQIHGPPISY